MSFNQNTVRTCHMKNAKKNKDLHTSNARGSQALICDAICLRMLLQELLFVREIPARL